MAASTALNPEINALLFLMASVSPKVKDAIENELYRAAADSDEATNMFILDDAVKNLLNDLSEIGLSFGFDHAELTDDLSGLSLFVDLVQLLLPNPLYEAMKRDDRILHLLRHIVDGSIGETAPAILVYFSELAGLDGVPPLRPHLAEYIDQLYSITTQTAIFTDYLRNLVKLHDEERPALLTDEVRLIAYHDKMKTVIGRISDAVNVFEDTPEYDEILRLQNFVIKDLLAAQNFIPYAYLFLENKASLPEALQEGYDLKWYHYRVSHAWCFDYFKVRKLDMPKVNQLIAACLVFAFSPTKDGYLEQIASLRQAYPDAQVDAKIASLYTE